MVPPEQQEKHPLPLWVRFLIVSLVVLIVIIGTVFWIIQGVQAIVPIAVLTALGTLIGFSQLLPSLFPQHTQNKKPLLTQPTHINSDEDLSHTHDSSNILNSVTQKYENSLEQITAVPTLTVDWGKAPQIKPFYDRDREIAEVIKWIVDEHCRITALLGIGGIGKSSIAYIVAEQVQHSFKFVYWYSLQNAPTLENLLQDCIQFFSFQSDVLLPKYEDEQIALFITYLQKYPCLVVLDNVESVLRVHNHAGEYLEGYEGYGKFLRRVGEAQHQGCLLLTSREKPYEVAYLEGRSSTVHSLFISGIDQVEGQKILQERGLFGSDKDLTSLILFYAGNPLALKIVSESIRAVFNGDVSAFLKEDIRTIRNFDALLEEQFQRLSTVEQDILYWLALEREPLALDTLYEDSIPHIQKQKIFAALESLQLRSLIENNNTGFPTLQPAILEFIVERIITQATMEINQEQFRLIASHALMKAQTKEYVREAQVRLVLIPLMERLLSTMHFASLEQKFKHILSKLRESAPRQFGYECDNILNLLAHTKYNLRNYDFSRLLIRQAYLRDVILQDVNFTGSSFNNTVFTDAFGSILSIALSHSGKLLAVGTVNTDIRLWRVEDGMPTLVCHGHTNWIRSVAFNYNDTILASGSDDRTIRLWSVDTGECIRVLRGHTDQVRSVSFSPDGQLLASGGDDQNIRLWNTNSGECISILPGHNDTIRSVAFDLAGKLLASASDDQTIRIWDITTGVCIHVLKEHTKRVYSVAFSPERNMLASSSEDNTIRIWDAQSGICLKVLQGHASRVWSVMFSSTGHLLASGGEDRTVRIWNIDTYECIETFSHHSDVVRSVAFASEGSVLASGSLDQTVRLWDVVSTNCLRVLQGYVNVIRAVACNPDGDRVASGSFDQVVRLWDVVSTNCLRVLQGYVNVIRAVACNPDGDRVASGSFDQVVRLWSTTNGICLAELRGHIDEIRCVAFSPGGPFLASGSDDRTIRIWNTNTYECLHILRDHTDEIASIVFSPDGRFLASGSDDRTVRIWGVSTGRSIAVLQGHTNSVGAVAFSPDGQFLASGSDDRMIKIWDLSTSRSINILQGHTDQIRSVAYSPDGQFLVSGSDDQTIRIWNMYTSKNIGVLYGHIDQIRSVAFSPNGKFFISGSHDGTLKIWDTQTHVCIKTLQSVRPYERMNITEVKGLNETQKSTLKMLGAIETEEK